MLVTTVCLPANDAAAAMSAGGLRLMPIDGVTMKKERLEISLQQVRVEYEFFHAGKTDVATLVAFPLPPEEIAGYGVGFESRRLGDFTVRVDERPVAYETEVRALLLDSLDVTAVLAREGIDPEAPQKALAQASPTTRQRLRQAGLLGGDDRPLWKIRRTHYWRQTFPAQKSVRIRHTYTPLIGFTYLGPQNGPRLACPDPALEKKMQTMSGVLGWVDYILTTANTWAGDIEEFELIVDRRLPGPYAEGKAPFAATWCWNAPIEQPAPGLFRSRIRHFTPDGELRIYFLIQL